MHRRTQLPERRPGIHHGIADLPSEPAIGAGRDRRERSIRVTEAGREVLEQALPLWEGAQSRLYSALGPVAFVSLLDRLDNVIDRAAA